MSKTTKRKHVTQEALTEYYVPEGEEEIVKVSNVEFESFFIVDHCNFMESGGINPA